MPSPQVSKPRLWTKLSLQTELQIVAFSLRYARTDVILLGVASALSGVAPILVAWVAKLIIDAVALHDGEKALILVGVEFLVVGMMVFLERWISFLHATITTKLGMEAKSSILASAVRRPVADFEDSAFYDSLTKVRRDSPSRLGMLLRNSFSVLRGLVMLIGCAGLISHYNPISVALLLLAVAPPFIAETRFSLRMFALRSQQLPRFRKAEYYEYLLSSDRHVKEIRAGDIGSLFLSRHRQTIAELNGEELKISKEKLRTLSIIATLSNAIFYTSYGMVALQAALNEISLSEMMLCIAIFRQAQSSLQMILGSANAFLDDRLYITQLFVFLEPPPQTTAKRTLTKSTERGIRLANVSFKYPSTDAWVLKGVNAFIPQGSFAAIVGSVGSGKSTLIKLIAGLYQPTEGDVLIDGRPTTDWSLSELAARTAVLFQDFGQYQFTVRENVDIKGRFPDDRRELEVALHGAGLADWMRRQPKGINTQLGKLFANGVDLSGGQWQRVALARLLLRSDADILILDEPTSALDANAEHHFSAEFDRFSKGRTTICITHRLSFVRHADRIMVLENGELVQEGNHESLLMANHRLYADMFEKQAVNYR